MQKQRDGSGIIFRNDRKEGDRDRDYSGSITIRGREYWLSGWIKEGKNGKFLSLSAKPKEEEVSAGKPDLNDEIPF